MKRTASQLKPRLIMPDDPDVPQEFAAIEAADIYDACDLAQVALLDDHVTLVVCHINHSEDVLGLGVDRCAFEKQNKLQQAIKTLSSRIVHPYKQAKTNLLPLSASLFNPFGDHLELGMRSHFGKIADITQADDATLKDWREESLLLAETLEENFNAKSLSLTTRFQNAAYHTDGVHTDNGLRSNSVRVLRVVAGVTPHFYGQDAVARRLSYRGISSIHLKENAQPWTIRPWDIAFITQNAVHEGPSPACGYDADSRRAVEVYQLQSRDEIVMNAQRPFFHRFFRRPLPEAF